MVEALRRQGGAEKLTEIFGYWPDFHDAEVLELHFSSGHIDANAGQFGLPALTIGMDLKEWAIPPGSNANAGIRRRIFATLRFLDVENFRMEGFNYQNAILGLHIDRHEKSKGSSFYFAVHFDPACGMEATFECRRVEVVDASSRNVDGKPTK